ncbi:MAG: GatB/YqeY domain-containing protein [Desulfobulbaceae bacterium]|nr:GatB/YqeY domain-containing protein [Desulfobulbaceae bacterium]
MSASTAYGWNNAMGTPLLKKLKEDMKTAMRNKDNTVRDAVRQVISEFPKLTMPLTLESGKKSTRLKTDEEITDDDIIGIIQGLVKSEKTVMEIKKETSSPYLDAIEAYLPQMATREEIAAWVDTEIDLSQFKSPMQAMGPIMKHFGKQADGNIVKDILQGLAGK